MTAASSHPSHWWEGLWMVGSLGQIGWYCSLALQGSLVVSTCLKKGDNTTPPERRVYCLVKWWLESGLHNECSNMEWETSEKASPHPKAPYSTFLNTVAYNNWAAPRWCLSLLSCLMVNNHSSSLSMTCSNCSSSSCQAMVQRSIV